MAKRKNKAYRRLDARIKAWNETMKYNSHDSGVAKRIASGGYRKPGSMKK